MYFRYIFLLQYIQDHWEDYYIYLDKVGNIRP